MDYIATFLEGMATFVSPCLLPMLPLYLAYFAGNAATANGADGKPAKGRMLVSVLGFVVGFAAVFVALGAFAGAIGGVLARYSLAVSVVCGLVVILFGLHFAGVLRIPLLDRALSPDVDVRPRNFASSFLFGIVFSIGWTPCVGVFLGTALALAATEGSAMQGALLLACYSAGLAIPFIACALAIDALAGALDAIKRHSAAISRVCGALLVVMGLVMALGPLIAGPAANDPSVAAESDGSPRFDNPQLADVVVADSEGYDIMIGALHEGKPMIVNLWATWCPFCVDEMADFQDLYDRYGDKVQFVMLNSATPSTEISDARDYLEEHQFTFPVYYDIYGQVQTLFSVAAYPTTIIIAADGEVLSNRPGRIDPVRFEALVEELAG